MKKEEQSRLAATLGASRVVVEVDQERVSGPLDMLSLRQEFDTRLRSSGGRPTDPAWNINRQVPFKAESWGRLQDLASAIGASGRRVGAAQVAALLVENSLEELDDARWAETLAESRAIPLLSEPEAAEASGVSYNQLDDWVQRGWILPASRRGRQRFFGADEVVRATWLRSTAEAGAQLNRLAEDVRASDLAARYLVITNGETVRAVSSRGQLYRLLASAGSHLVIDQLPERRKLLGLPPFPDDGTDEQRIRQAV